MDIAKKNHLSTPKSFRDEIATFINIIIFIHTLSSGNRARLSGPDHSLFLEIKEGDFEG